MQAHIRSDSGRQFDYEAGVLNDDIRGGVVACAPISHEGKYVALGFGNGAVENADIDDSCTISQFRCEPPHGSSSSRVTVELL